MRLVIATIAAACSIAVMIDTPRRELEEELKQQWQEYRQHTGEIPPFPATSKIFQILFRVDWTQNDKVSILHPSDARCGRRNKKQGAEK